MDNKSLMRRFYQEVVNERRLEVIDEICAEDAVDHQVPPGLPPGREGIRAWFAGFMEAVPDLHVEMGEMLAEGDLCAARAIWTGTQQGDLPGLPATGKGFTVEGIDLVRFADGRAVEHWGVTDEAGMLRQLGVIPEPAMASS